MSLSVDVALFLLQEGDELFPKDASGNTILSDADFVETWQVCYYLKSYFKCTSYQSLGSSFLQSTSLSSEVLRAPPPPHGLCHLAPLLWLCKATQHEIVLFMA